MNFASITTAMLQTTLQVQSVLTELDLCVENVIIQHEENAETCLCEAIIDAECYRVRIIQNTDSIHDHDLIIQVYTVEDQATEFCNNTQLQFHMSTDNIETFKSFMSVQSQF